MDGAPGFHMVSLTRALVVEGEAPEGDFRGVAIAVGWWVQPPQVEGGAGGRAQWQWTPYPDAAPPEPHYLVSDPRKPNLIWVTNSQVLRQTHGVGG
jgi:hypothetical protein